MDSESEGTSIDPVWQPRFQTLHAGSPHDASDTMSSGFGDDPHPDDNQQIVTADLAARDGLPEGKINGRVLAELQGSLTNLQSRYTALQTKYNRLKVESEYSASQANILTRSNRQLLCQREEDCQKLESQLDAIKRKAVKQKERMTEDFNSRMNGLRKEMSIVVIQKEAVESQLQRARQELTAIQKSNLLSLSQLDVNDNSSLLKEELDKTKTTLEHTQAKLRELTVHAEEQKRENIYNKEEREGQITPSLIPGLVDDGTMLKERVEFLDRKLQESWDEHAAQLTTVEQKLLRENSKWRGKHTEFQLKYEKQKGKTKAGYEKIKQLRLLVSSLQAFGTSPGYNNHLTDTNGTVHHRYDSLKPSDWLKIWTNPDKREKQLQQIFNEIKGTKDGPDGAVKDHVFFQKVILFIWNQRNEIRQKLLEKLQHLDGNKKALTDEELENLQGDLNNVITENSTMEASYNMTIDQLVSENKELLVKIKHLEKTISALHHDNNLWRLEMDKHRSKDQSHILEQTTDSRVVTLKAEVECVRQHCSLLKAEISNGKKRNDNLMTRLTQVEQEGQQYVEQLKNKQCQMDRLEIQNKALEKQIDSENAELDQGRSSLTSLVAKKQVADTRIKELEKKLKEVLDKNEQLSSGPIHRQPVVEEIVTRTHIKNLEKQNDIAIDEYEHEEKIADLETELSSANVQIEVLQKQLNGRPHQETHAADWMYDGEAWSRVFAEKQRAESKLKEVKEKMIENDEELAKLRAENDEIKMKLGTALQRSEMNGLKNKLQLEEEKMMLRVDVDGKLRSASVKEDELKKELEKMVMEYEIKMNQLEINLRSKEREATSLNQELAILLNENMQMKTVWETLNAESNNKLMEIGALTTQLEGERGRKDKTRLDLEQMLSQVSKERDTLGHVHCVELSVMAAKLKEEESSREQLVKQLTEARIESTQTKHKLQTVENSLQLEQTMNKANRNQHERFNNEKSNLEKELDALQIEKMKWISSDAKLNQRMDTLCKEKDNCLQDLLKAHQHADQQKQLFMVASKSQKETAERIEDQLANTQTHWTEERKELEEQRKQLINEKQELKERFALRDGKVYVLEEMIKQLQEDKRASLDFRSKLATAQSGLNNMEVIVEKLTLERDQYANEASQFKQSLTSTHTYKKSLESQLKVKENDISSQQLSYSDKFQSMKSRLQKTQNSLATVREGLQNARYANDSLRKEKSDLLTKVEFLRESWEADKLKLVIIEERCANIASNQEVTMTTLNDIENNNRTLNSTLLDFDNKYSAERSKVRMLLESQSEFETKSKSYDMRVKILDEQVSYYKKRLRKEESTSEQTVEEMTRNTNNLLEQTKKQLDDLTHANKILQNENTQLKQELTMIRQYMDEQKVEHAHVQSSAYDNDIKQRELQWKMDQMARELSVEREIQDKLEKSCDDKDLEIHTLKKELTEREEKQKIEEQKHSRNDGNASDQSIVVDLEHMIKDLSSEIKMAISKKTATTQANDSDDKKKNNDFEMKIHMLHMQRLADMEMINQLQSNVKGLARKLDRKDLHASSMNVTDRSSASTTDICQALARAQVRAYAMSLNESPLFRFEGSHLTGIYPPGVSFTSPSVRTSTPHRNMPNTANDTSQKTLFN